MNSEHIKKTGVAITALAIMVASMGCCNTTGNCPPSARQPAYASKFRRVRTPDGGFLYRLGSGMTANSSSVELGGQCVPARAFDRRSASRVPTAPNCLPCETPVPDMRPAPAVAPQTGACATGSGDWPDLGSVCDSPGGDALGACYTLSDEEAASGPAMYVPSAGALESLATPDRAEDDPAIPETVSMPAVVETAEAMPEAAPVELTEPAAMAEEPAMPEAAAPTVADAETELPAETAVAAAPAPVLEMPPVFRKGATEAAAAEVLSRIGKVESIDALSPIELPPDL